jgi:hypothetical protein
MQVRCSRTKARRCSAFIMMALGSSVIPDLRMYVVRCLTACG